MSMNIIERNSKVLCWVMFILSLIIASLAMLFLVKYKAEAGDNFDDFRYKHVIYSLWGGLYGPASIMLFYRLFPNIPTSFVKYFHALGHVFCLYLLVVGIQHGYKASELNGHEHMSNLHDMLSVVFLSFYGLNFIVAFFIFLYMRTSQKVRRFYGAMHSFVGFISFFLAILICCQGVQYIMLHFDEEGSVDIPLHYCNAIKYCLVVYFIIVYFILVNPFFEWPEVGDI